MSIWKALQQKKFISLLILFFAITCIATADSNSKQRIPSFRIAGNLYFVGDHYAASYLIVTSQGNILINSNDEKDVPKIKANIEKLGFKFSDTKILLISHAHFDHNGGSALIKKLTHAKYFVMDQDVDVVESGGKSDFHYGKSNDPDMFYPATKVDRALHDGEKIKLGDTVLVAHLTAGHTKGCTTWTMKVTEKNKVYDVVIVGGPFVSPGYKLKNNLSYPSIAQDYKNMFNTLKSLPCDIFLGAHGMYFDLEKKYAHLNKTKINPFIDPAGYKKFIVQKEKDFYKELGK